MLWLTCEGQIDVVEIFSDNSYMSAIFDREGLQVAAPIDLRTNKTESFSPQLIQGFWQKIKKKNTKIVVMSPTAETKSFKKKWYGNRTNYVLTWQNKFLAETLPYFGTRIRIHLVVEKGAISPFFSLGNLLRPLELTTASRERVVPTEWQVRTVLGDCISRATVIPAPAPQSRQHAPISDFLDLAHLSLQEEAASATNWIKDPPERSRLQNFALAIMAGPVMSSSPKNLTADVQHAITRCESLGSGKLLSFTGILRQLLGIFHRMWQSFDVNFCRTCAFQCCMLLQGTLGYDFDIFAASGESTAWVLFWK